MQVPEPWTQFWENMHSTDQHREKKPSDDSYWRHRTGRVFALEVRGSAGHRTGLVFARTLRGSAGDPEGIQGDPWTEQGIRAF